jgi:hypothetical protein
MEGGMNDEEKYIADQIGNVKFRGMQGRGGEGRNICGYVAGKMMELDVL